MQYETHILKNGEGMMPHVRCGTLNCATFCLYLFYVWMPSAAGIFVPSQNATNPGVSLENVSSARSEPFVFNHIAEPYVATTIVIPVKHRNVPSLVVSLPEDVWNLYAGEISIESLPCISAQAHMVKFFGACENTTTESCQTEFEASMQIPGSPGLFIAAIWQAREANISIYDNSSLVCKDEKRRPVNSTAGAWLDLAKYMPMMGMQVVRMLSTSTFYPQVDAIELVEGGAILSYEITFHAYGMHNSGKDEVSSAFSRTPFAPSLVLQTTDSCKQSADVGQMEESDLVTLSLLSYYHMDEGAQPLNVETHESIETWRVVPSASVLGGISAVSNSTYKARIYVAASQNLVQQPGGETSCTITHWLSNGSTLPGSATPTSSPEPVDPLLWPTCLSASLLRDPSQLQPWSNYPRIQVRVLIKDDDSKWASRAEIATAGLLLYALYALLFLTRLATTFYWNYFDVSDLRDANNLLSVRKGGPRPDICIMGSKRFYFFSIWSLVWMLQSAALFARLHIVCEKAPLVSQLVILASSPAFWEHAPYVPSIFQSPGSKLRDDFMAELFVAEPSVATYKDTTEIGYYTFWPSETTIEPTAPLPDAESDRTNGTNSNNTNASATRSTTERREIAARRLSNPQMEVQAYRSSTETFSSGTERKSDVQIAGGIMLDSLLRVFLYTTIALLLRFGTVRWLRKYMSRRAKMYRLCPAFDANIQVRVGGSVSVKKLSQAEHAEFLERRHKREAATSTDGDNHYGRGQTERAGDSEASIAKVLTIASPAGLELLVRRIQYYIPVQNVLIVCFIWHAPMLLHICCRSLGNASTAIVVVASFLIFISFVIWLCSFALITQKISTSTTFRDTVMPEIVKLALDMQKTDSEIRQLVKVFSHLRGRWAATNRKSRYLLHRYGVFFTHLVYSRNDANNKKTIELEVAINKNMNIKENTIAEGSSGTEKILEKNEQGASWDGNGNKLENLTPMDEKSEKRLKKRELRKLKKERMKRRKDARRQKRLLRQLNPMPSRKKPYLFSLFEIAHLMILAIVVASTSSIDESGFSQLLLFTFIEIIHLVFLASLLPYNSKSESYIHIFGSFIQCCALICSFCLVFPQVNMYVGKEVVEQIILFLSLVAIFPATAAEIYVSLSMHLRFVSWVMSRYCAPSVKRLCKKCIDYICELLRRGIFKCSHKPSDSLDNADDNNGIEEVHIDLGKQKKSEYVYSQDAPSMQVDDQCFSQQETKPEVEVLEDELKELKDKLDGMGFAGRKTRHTLPMEEHQKAAKMAAKQAWVRKELRGWMRSNKASDKRMHETLIEAGCTEQQLQDDIMAAKLAEQRRMKAILIRKREWEKFEKSRQKRQENVVVNMDSSTNTKRGRSRNS